MFEGRGFLWPSLPTYKARLGANQDFKITPEKCGQGLLHPEGFWETAGWLKIPVCGFIQISHQEFRSRAQRCPCPPPVLSHPLAHLCTLKGPLSWQELQGHHPPGSLCCANANHHHSVDGRREACPDRSVSMSPRQPDMGLLSAGLPEERGPGCSCLGSQPISPRPHPCRSRCR